MRQKAVTIPDPTGFAVYQLGRRLNEFVFHARRANLLRGDRDCPAQQRARAAFGHLIGLSPSMPKSKLDRLLEQVRAYCQDWIDYWGTEQHADDRLAVCEEFSSLADELGSTNQARQEILGQSIRCWELAWDDWLTGLHLAPQHLSLLKLGVQVDRGLHPRQFWRNARASPTKPAPVSPPEKQECHERSDSKDDVDTDRCSPSSEKGEPPQARPPLAKRNGPEGSVAPPTVATETRDYSQLLPILHAEWSSDNSTPETGWRELVNASLKTSSYPCLRSLRIGAGTANEAIQRLDVEIEGALVALRPRWVRNERCLYLGTLVLKDWTRSPAGHQQQLVEAFQEAGWPESIEDPFGDPDLLDLTVRNFNRSVKGKTFKFRIRERATVSWKLDRNSPGKDTASRHPV